MLDDRTHSIAELVEISGFDRRTIVYYLNQGLIERPGRRGPKTRYPAEALTRLLFIRGVRELQDAGQLLNVTLSDIRHAIDAAGGRLREIVARNLPVGEVADLLAAPPAPVAVTVPEPAPTPDPVPPPPPPRPASPPPQERRAFGLADANVRQRFAASGGRPAAETPAPVPPPASGQRAEGTTPPAAPTESPPASALQPEAADLGQLLRELEIRPAMGGRRLAPGAAEQWTEIPITSRVYLSVRGLSAEDAPLADATARALKKLLRA